MADDAGLTEHEAKRRMAAEFHNDHAKTVNAYPVLRYEVGLLYQQMDDLPMYRFRSWLRSIERLVQDIERSGSGRCWACGRQHEGVVCPVDEF